MEERIHPPMPPGRVLELEFMEPLGMTSYGLAKGIGVDPPPRLRYRARQEGHNCRHRASTSTVLRYFS